MNNLYYRFPLNGDCIEKIEKCIRRQDIFQHDNLKEEAYLRFLETLETRLKSDHLNTVLIDPVSHVYKNSPCNVISYSLYHYIERCQAIGLFYSLFYLRDMDILSEKSPIL